MGDIIKIDKKISDAISYKLEHIDYQMAMRFEVVFRAGSVKDPITPGDMLDAVINIVAIDIRKEFRKKIERAI